MIQSQTVPAAATPVSEGPVSDAAISDAKRIDDFLQARFDLGLEDILCDGCLMGRLDQRLGAGARIVLREQRIEREDDGGEFGTYAGVLILDGVWYNFSCHIFVDAGGQCFVADIGAFEAIEWKLRMAV
ncbi:MAG TPA: hypothetical protein VHX19_10000 [Stellaceae bacterium]|jgi:hypothetical protein|nr:hypothetical protein [Stellaceae bacterium]